MQWGVVGFCLVALFALGATKAVNNEVGKPFICPHADGKFIDPENCHGFYVCKDWKPTPGKCDNPEEDWNPLDERCQKPDDSFMCRVFVHPENHHIKHTYYITDCGGLKGEKDDHFCTAKQGNATCQAAGMELTDILNWDEDSFLKNFTEDFENEFHKPHRFTYWTSGYRTEHSTDKHRDFVWWTDNSYMGYSDWCDAGLLKKEGEEAPMFPESCRPDELSHECVHLNTSYIESYGWWDAANCAHDYKNYAICEHHYNQGRTTPGPVPTTQKPTTAKPTTPKPTTPKPTTPKPTTPKPTRAPTTAHTFEEFLHWFNCHEESVHGFCEKYYTCDPDADGNIIKHPHDCLAGTMFSFEANDCIDIADLEGDYCDTVPNDCEKTGPGIFRNKRNCGMFFACTAAADGGFIQKDYVCPDGWLFSEADGLCVPKTLDVDHLYCEFDHQIPDPTIPTPWADCTAEGRVAYNDPDWPDDAFDFIMCVTYEGSIGMLGPWHCHAGTEFRNGQCE